jgi:hypothetical protein
VNERVKQLLVLLFNTRCQKEEESILRGEMGARINLELNKKNNMKKKLKQRMLEEKQGKMSAVSYDEMAVSEQIIRELRTWNLEGICSRQFVRNVYT